MHIQSFLLDDVLEGVCLHSEKAEVLFLLPLTSKRY